MNALSFITTNALEGVIGGASSIIPVVLVTNMVIYLNPIKYRESYVISRQEEEDYIASVISIIIGIFGGITGGVLTDNYNNSIYNGIQYGILSSTIIYIVLTMYDLLWGPRHVGYDRLKKEIKYDAS